MNNEFMLITFLNNKFRNLIIKIPLVDRWLIGQLIPPMLFAIGAFTTVSLSVGIMFDLVRKIVEFGLPLQIALKVLILKLPGFLVLSFPMSMLLATLLAYGKLSSNSELLALKSLGYTNKRIIIPVVFLSLLSIDESRFTISEVTKTSVSGLLIIFCFRLVNIGINFDTFMLSFDSFNSLSLFR